MNSGKNGFSATPPASNAGAQVDPAALEDFVSGAAERKPPIESEKPDLPWEQPGVRDDVKRQVPLRIPEPLKLKLDFIANTHRMSIHRYCLDAVQARIEADLPEILGQR